MFSDITLTGCSEIPFTLNKAQIHKSPEKGSQCLAQELLSAANY